MRTPKHFDGYTVVTTAFMFIFVAMLAYAVGGMILRAFTPNGHFDPLLLVSTYLRPDIVVVLRNTLLITVGGTAGAVFLGSGLAWLNERTTANLGLVGSIMPVLPMLLPAVALPIGWIFIADPRTGFLNAILHQIPLLRHLQVNIYSWAGLIWMYTISGVPFVYLIVGTAFRNLDSSIEEASLISGANHLKTMFRVTIPAVMPSVLAACVLLVINCLGNYAVPAIKKICVEMHGHQLVHNVPTLFRLREAIGPIVGANLDPSHLFWMGADPLAAVTALGNAIHHVHAKDTILTDNVRLRGRIETADHKSIGERAWNYITLGYGHDEQWWREFCYRLGQVGYDGWLSIEHEDPVLSPVEGLRKSVDLLENTMLHERAA